MSSTGSDVACCIVGGGPAGAVLALLLARCGVSVTLLERHPDFERDFRGDTIHPSVMDIMEDLGLAERLLRLPHAKLRTAAINTRGGLVRIIDFGRLRSRHPYVTMLPQARFLELVTSEAERHPCFRLVMGARVEELVEEQGVVRGVRYRTSSEMRELRAGLVVGADGRFSVVRRLARMEAVPAAQPVDVLWLRLPRAAGDQQETGTGYMRGGRAAILLDRGGEWQVALIIRKGSFPEMRAAGLDALRRAVAETIPPLADRVHHLDDWGSVSLLSVAADRVRRWHRPGLLLIGDAAHVMSPVGGVGINYAIQDAVEAANVLAGPLVRGEVGTGHLAAVQRRREWPTRVIQAFQGAMLRRLVARALDGERPFRLPWAVRVLIRIPVVRDLPAWLVAYGIRPARVAPCPKRGSSNG